MYLNFELWSLEEVFTIGKNASFKGNTLVLSDQSTPQDQCAFEAVLLMLIPHTGVSIWLHCAFLKSHVYTFTYGNTDYFIINYFSFSFPLSRVCV